MKLRYVAILVILLFIVGCAPKEAPKAPETPVTTPAVEEPVAPVEAPVVEQAPEEVLPAAEGKEVPKVSIDDRKTNGLLFDLTTESTAFSEVVCGEKKISIKITNIGQKEWVIEKEDYKKTNVAIMDRGIADVTPECAKKVLAPGESTVCTGINAGFYKGENRVSVSTPDGHFARLVTCP